MSNTLSVPIDMETLRVLGLADIGHDGSSILLDPQLTSCRPSETFGFDSLAPQPYNFTGDGTTTSIKNTGLVPADLPMVLPDHPSILDPSQAFQPEKVMPTSYVSTEVANLVVTQSNTPKFWATQNDWTRHRALITDLYGENKLPKVMSIMESQEGFKATVKMYKTHIAKWGLDKKYKEPEMRAIIRKNRKRAGQGKRSRFRVRERDLDFVDVIRYWKRKGVTVDEVIARSMASPTPETVECFTVVSSPITPPEDLATPEYVLRTIRGYVTASFESGTWVKTDPQTLCYSMKASRHARSIMDIYNTCRLAGDLFLMQNLDEVENTVFTTSAISRKMLIAEQPETLTIILERLAVMQSYHCYEIVLRILHQVSATSKELLGESHPLYLFTAWLAAMKRSQMTDIISRCFDVMTADFESFLGPMHSSALSYRLGTYTLKDNLATLRILLNTCESALGSYDVRTLYVRARLMACSWEKRSYMEAIRMGEDLLALVQSNEAIVDWLELQIDCYNWIAFCHRAFGETDLAIANLQATIILSMRCDGCQDGALRYCLFALEWWNIEQGNLDAAMMARDQRIRLLGSKEIV